MADWNKERAGTWAAAGFWIGLLCGAVAGGWVGACVGGVIGGLCGFLVGGNSDDSRGGEKQGPWDRGNPGEWQDGGE